MQPFFGLHTASVEVDVNDGRKNIHQANAFHLFYNALSELKAPAPPTWNLGGSYLSKDPCENNSSLSCNSQYNVIM